MKKILLALLLLVPSLASADTCSTRLMPAFPAGQASVLCNSWGNGNFVLKNNTFLKVRNAAGTADLNLIKIDSNNDTILNAASGRGVYLQYDSSSGWALDGSGNWVNDVNTGGQLQLTKPGTTLALQESSAAAACSGTVTANGTTAVVVSTTCASTGARIFISRSSAPSGTAICWTDTIVNGVSFNLDCSGAETGTHNWVIFKEAP